MVVKYLLSGHRFLSETCIKTLKRGLLNANADSKNNGHVRLLTHGGYQLSDLSWHIQFTGQRGVGNRLKI